MKGADIEDIIDGIVESLQHNLPAALGALAAEKRVVVAVPVPREEDIIAGDRPINDGVPRCEVVGHTTVYDHSGDYGVKATHTIDVTWIYAGSTEDEVIRVVQRLCRASRDVLWESVLDGTYNIEPIKVEGDDYSELLMKAEGAPLLKGGRLHLRVTGLTV